MDSLPSRVVALAPNCSQAPILDPAGFNLAAARSTTGGLGIETEAERRAGEVMSMVALEAAG